MGSYGIRVSIAGQDVKTCSDLDTIVNSKYANLKGSLSGSGSETVLTSATKIITINHGLDNIPFCQMFVKSPFDTSYFQAPLLADGPDGNIVAKHKFTSTQLIITFINNTLSSRTFDYKYFIYLDKGNLN